MWAQEPQDNSQCNDCRQWHNLGDCSRELSEEEAEQTLQYAPCCRSLHLAHRACMTSSKHELPTRACHKPHLVVGQY